MGQEIVTSETLDGNKRICPNPNRHNRELKTHLQQVGERNIDRRREGYSG